VPTGGGDFHRSFYMLLAFDLAEIEFLFAGSPLGPTVGRADRSERNIPPQKMHHLRKRTCPVHLDALHHGRFRRIVRRNDESLPMPPLGFQGNRQDSLHRRNWPESANSPLMQNASRSGNRLFSSSFNMPRAIGRSKLGPSLRTSAGAR
jgi:hypothetical protein